MHRVALMYSELPIHGAYCDLEWQKFVFTRCSAGESSVCSDLVRVSTEIKLAEKEGAQLPKRCENSLLDQTANLSVSFAWN